MEKQIEEMAELERLLRIRRMDIEKQGCDIWALIKKTESEEQSIADYLIRQGYRKASEVAKEIGDEIAKNLMQVTAIPNYVAIEVHALINIINKYEEEKDNDR